MAIGCLGPGVVSAPSSAAAGASGLVLDSTPCGERHKGTILKALDKLEAIETAMERVGTDNTIMCHSTSTYPCKVDELNLSMIPKLRELFDVPIGYSGHEVGLATTVAAAALGACMIERHITLDRSMWGSDQAASVESMGVMRLVKDIRSVEAALGDGEKVVYDSEKPIIAKLRRVGK